MKNRLVFWVALYLLAFSVTAQAAVENPNRQEHGQRIVTGTIEKLANNKITIKTDEGKAHDFTISSSEQVEYANKGLRRGDRVILSYSRQHRIIGVNKIIEGIPYNKDLWLVGSTQIKF